MIELETDLWTVLLPSEWQAEQDDETVFIVDDDEVSIIEITPLLVESGNTDGLLASLLEPQMTETVLADMPAYYHELVDDDMFWREWYCHAGDFVLTVSHGTDKDNQGLDDGSVNEILSTLLIKDK